MDNDNKIGRELTGTQRHKDVLLFLNDELKKLQNENSVNAYNLEEEYAKTRSHKSPFALIVILSSIAVVFLTAFIMTRVIARHNQEISVNLSEFDDLNLKSLLDSASRLQTSYDNALKQKTKLVNERDSRLRDAESHRDRELFTLETMNIRSASEAEQRRMTIQESYEDRIAQINEEYEQLIADAEVEISVFRDQLDEYDSSRLEQAKEHQNALSSQQQVNELERQRLISQYEQQIERLDETIESDRRDSTEEMRRALTEVSEKYQAEIDLLDPLLEDSDAALLIRSLSENSEREAFDWGALAEENGIQSETILDHFAQYQSVYDSYKYLRRPFVQIPYKNNLPSYIEAENQLVDDMSRIFADSSIEMDGQKMELEGRLAQLESDRRADVRKYESVLDGLLAFAKSSAAVISAEAKDSIIIYVASNARYLLTDEGIEVEIRSDKPVKGTVLNSETGYCTFVPAVDKEGKQVAFDLAQITPGLSVKLIAK